MATRNDSPDPRHHTSACLERGVDAYCDDKPDPGCTCGRPGGTVPDVDDAEALPTCDCDYCSTALAANCDDLACASCQAKIDAADEYPPCPICGDPIDYCQGHGNERVLDTAAPA